jgi:integrase/recombinase XerD
MKLSVLVHEYIDHKRSLGMIFHTQGAQLKAFLRHVGNIELDTIPPTAVRKYLDGDSESPTMTWFVKYRLIKNIFKYAISRSYTTSVPLPKSLPAKPRTLTPYIYTVPEIRRLLGVSDSRYSPRGHIEPETMRCLLLLLYGAGLRVSEALQLKVGDVDLRQGVLTIKQTKFFKSRLVPVGPELLRMLRGYQSGKRLHHEYEGERPFLCSRRLTPIHFDSMENTFKWLRREAGIHRSDGGRYQPRLHDLRHTFAVIRLVTWYREGKNVQHLLPYLATYMGHVNIHGVSTYLTMTKELLRQANRCFELYALGEVRHD